MGELRLPEKPLFVEFWPDDYCDWAVFDYSTSPPTEIHHNWSKRDAWSWIVRTRAALNPKADGEA